MMFWFSLTNLQVVGFSWVFVCLSYKAQYNDILCINRYFAWYSDCSHTELINLQLTNDLQAFHSKYSKPVIVTEYGADTIPGLHQVRWPMH